MCSICFWVKSKTNSIFLWYFIYKLSFSNNLIKQKERSDLWKSTMGGITNSHQVLEGTLECTYPRDKKKVKLKAKISKKVKRRVVKKAEREREKEREMDLKEWKYIDRKKVGRKNENC